MRMWMLASKNCQISFKSDSSPIGTLSILISLLILNCKSYWEQCANLGTAHYFPHSWSWGVIVVLWVENSLHKLPTKFLTSWPQSISSTLLLQLRCWKVSQSGAHGFMPSGPKSSPWRQYFGAWTFWVTWYKELSSLVMLSGNSIVVIFTPIWNLLQFVLLLCWFFWVSSLSREHRLFTTIVVQSWRTLTFSVTTLDLTLCMLDSWQQTVPHVLVAQ